MTEAMNNEMTLTTRENHLDLVMNMIAMSVRRPLHGLSVYYSHVLERRINLRQTLLLINAQLAFAATAFPTECPVLLRIACGAWLVSALLKCREEL
jgi:hypothetical protein